MRIQQHSLSPFIHNKWTWIIATSLHFFFSSLMNDICAREQRSISIHADCDDCSTHIFCILIVSVRPTFHTIVRSQIVHNWKTSFDHLDTKSFLWKFNWIIFGCWFLFFHSDCVNHKENKRWSLSYNLNCTFSFCSFFKKSIRTIFNRYFSRVLRSIIWIDSQPINSTIDHVFSAQLDFQHVSNRFP